MTRFTHVEQRTVALTNPENTLVIPLGIGAITVQGRDGTVKLAYSAGHIAGGLYFSAPQVGTGKPYHRGLINNRNRTLYLAAGTATVAEVELWS